MFVWAGFFFFSPKTYSCYLNFVGTKISIDWTNWKSFFSCLFQFVHFCEVVQIMSRFQAPVAVVFHKPDKKKRTLDWHYLYNYFSLNGRNFFFCRWCLQILTFSSGTTTMDHFPLFEKQPVESSFGVYFSNTCLAMYAVLSIFYFCSCSSTLVMQTFSLSSFRCWYFHLNGKWSDLYFRRSWLFEFSLRRKNTNTTCEALLKWTNQRQNELCNIEKKYNIQTFFIPENFPISCWKI